MPAKQDDLEKVTLNLRLGDKERIRDIFPELNWSTVVRTLVSKYVDQLTAGQSEAPKTDIQL